MAAESAASTSPRVPAPCVSTSSVARATIVSPWPTVFTACPSQSSANRRSLISSRTPAMMTPGCGALSPGLLTAGRPCRSGPSAHPLGACRHLA